MNISYLSLDMEFNEDDLDLYQNEDDSDLSQKECNCANCMNCLGLSWRDFM